MKQAKILKFISWDRDKIVMAMARLRKGIARQQVRDEQRD